MSVNSERKNTFVAIFLVVGAIFLIRLFYLQIIDTSYKQSALNNTIRRITEYPARGNIYDRNNKLLVYNEAAYDLKVIPKQVKDIDTAEFCEILGITVEHFREKFNSEKYRKFRSYPHVFEKLISADTYAVLQEELHKFPGFYVQTRILRKHKYDVAAHVLGYMIEVDDDDLEEDKYYRSGDYIGITGIEKVYEKDLRGEKGVSKIVIDKFRQALGKLDDGKYDTAAVSGKSLITTLDLELQKYGEDLIKNKIGSIVAIEPSTGEVLAFISSPSYKPSSLVGRALAKNYPVLDRDSLSPLFNRALCSEHPPGSTFKLINALIGLQEGVINQNSYFGCNMGYHVKGLSVGCHAHPTPLNLKQSIQHSCNAYYCNVYKMIIDNIKFKNSTESYKSWTNYLSDFSIGKKTNCDLPGEEPGIVKPASYFNNLYGTNRWRALTIISMSIGQGELGVTPIQLANQTACIANRGYYYTPHFVKMIENEKSIDEKYATKHVVPIKKEYFDIVVDGMDLVVQGGPGSTARWSRIDSIKMCGKTGTAQNPHGKDHSIFTAFAPKEDPKIAIAVFIENGGFGSTWAAPIASLMIEKYLSDTIARPWIEERMLNGNLINPQITQ